MRACQAILLCVGLGLAASAWADCRDVQATSMERVIPSPRDPLGRMLGNVDGTLTGANTAMVISITPGSGGILNITIRYLFATRQGDMLAADGVAVYAPVPGQGTGEFQVAQNLTITGGTGVYSGATGLLTGTGQAHNLFAGPGLAFLKLRYTGRVCS